MKTNSKSSVRRQKQTTSIDGCVVECLHSRTLKVWMPNGQIITVLALGTHSALNVLGDDTKKKIVRWWQEVR